MSRKRKEIDLTTYTGRFALRLRTLREAAGLNIDQLAEKSGIPRTTLFRWESASNSPPLETLPILAKALGVKVRILIPEE